VLGREHVHPHALDGHLDQAPAHVPIIPCAIEPASRGRRPAGRAGGLPVVYGLGVGFAEADGEVPGLPEADGAGVGKVETSWRVATPIRCSSIQ
jgi:hypothetical protein